MFTGIIEEVGRISSVQPGNLVIAASDVLQGVNLGSSMAVNGVCLTITSFRAGSFSVDIMPETRERTNLGRLRAGDRVNLERPLVLGGQLGGHLVQGHVDDTGRVASIEWNEEAVLIRFEAALEVIRYVVEKGFIAVDGVSLTVMARDFNAFQVSVVDYTRRHTTLGGRRIGDLVNLEVDIIAKYAAQISRARRPDISFDFLREHGFLIS